jgi:arylsulfatase A-like enzyme
MCLSLSSKPGGVGWVAKLPKQNQTNIDYNDEFFRNRLRALQAVDEMVEGIVRRLDRLNILDRTYIIYSTDNGYHIGQHRLQPGKECGFEEDINIPLIIRGPGVPKGKVTDIVTSHTDLAPTLFTVMGIPLRKDFDGAPIPTTHRGIAEAAADRHEHVNIEYWGGSRPESKYGHDG